MLDPAGLDMTLAVASQFGIRERIQREGRLVVTVFYPWAWSCTGPARRRGEANAFPASAWRPDAGRRTGLGLAKYENARVYVHAPWVRR